MWALVEILTFALAVVPAISTRAKQRGAWWVPYTTAAVVGYTVIYLLGLGWSGLLLRWLWVGVVYLVVEFLSAFGRKSAGTWQCPDCLMFNDARTLRCLCGHPCPEKIAK
jgi:hypothetical protein